MRLNRFNKLQNKNYVYIFIYSAIITGGKDIEITIHRLNVNPFSDYLIIGPGEK